MKKLHHEMAEGLPVPKEKNKDKELIMTVETFDMSIKGAYKSGYHDALNGRPFKVKMGK